MRKLISILLTFALFGATVVNAAGPYTTKADILNDLGITDPAQQDSIDTEFFQNVDADIAVKKTGDSAYVDGPINVQKTSSQAFPKFDFRASFNMQPVWQFMYDYINTGASLIGGSTALSDLQSVGVSGQFIVQIIYPNNFIVPDSFLNGTALEGFNAPVFNAFEETAPRTLALDHSGENTVLTITVDVKSGMTCGQLQGYYDPAAADDFILECIGVQPTAYGTHTVRGVVTGNVQIGNTIATVDYNAVQSGTGSNETLYAQVGVSQSGTTPDTPGPGPAPGPGGAVVTPPVPDDVTVQFSVNGNTDIVPALTDPKSVTVNYDAIRPPVIEGMTFDGWYVDPGYTSKLTGTQTVVGSITVYGRYIVTTAPEVFADDHRAYIKGYPDGTVQPNGNITREEVTVALYRLLKDDVAASILAESNNYTDVEDTRWSNTTISSMSKAGYIKGYEDGTFRPANDITRAEFATLVLRFFQNTDSFSGGSTYSDIQQHWAKENIILANAMGLFNGYEDGTFRPDAYITRAEAMAVINRITVRRSTIDSFAEGFIDWPDISTSDWYYVDVIEATNSHDFIRVDELMTEDWTEVSYSELIVG